MGILAKAGTALKNIGAKLKSTFAPSAEVAAARRVAVFGSDSKAGAALKIGGTAAALIAAPIVAKKVVGMATKPAAIKAGQSIKEAVKSKAKETLTAKAGDAIDSIGNKEKETQTESIQGMGSEQSPIDKIIKTVTTSTGAGKAYKSLTSSTSTAVKQYRGVKMGRRKKTALWYKRQTELLKAKKEYAKARGY